MYLFLVEIYHNIGPASLLGLSYTSAGFLFAGWVGGLVDKMSRMKFVRLVITLRKVYSMLFSLIHTETWVYQVQQVANYALLLGESPSHKQMGV